MYLFVILVVLLKTFVWSHSLFAIAMPLDVACASEVRTGVAHMWMTKGRFVSYSQGTLGLSQDRAEAQWEEYTCDQSISRRMENEELQLWMKLEVTEIVFNGLRVPSQWIIQSSVSKNNVL